MSDLLSDCTRTVGHASAGGTAAAVAGAGASGEPPQAGGVAHVVLGPHSSSCSTCSRHSPAAGSVGPARCLAAWLLARVSSAQPEGAPSSPSASAGRTVRHAVSSTELRRARARASSN